MLGQLRDSIPSAERKSRRLLSECKALADQCIREVRTLSYVLHPPVLDEAGLEDAIRDYVDGFTKRSGIHVELELSPRVGRMPRDVELALFRVVQEASPTSSAIREVSKPRYELIATRISRWKSATLASGISASEQRGKRKNPGSRLVSASPACRSE